MTKCVKLAELLHQLEAQLKTHGLWQQTMPSPQALQSAQPFAIDTLQPHEWLQWIFIARMQTLIESNQPLPSGFAVEPYFAEVWKQEPQFSDLLMTLQNIDELCK